MPPGFSSRYCLRRTLLAPRGDYLLLIGAKDPTKTLNRTGPRHPAWDLDRDLADWTERWTRHIRLPQISNA